MKLHYFIHDLNITFFFKRNSLYNYFCLFSQGEFSTIIELPEGEHEYKFCVDGRWIHDPNAVSTLKYKQRWGGGGGSAHVQLATNLSQDIEVLFDVKCLFLILLLFSMVLFLMISSDSTFASYVTVVSTTLMLLTNIIS